MDALNSGHFVLHGGKTLTYHLIKLTVLKLWIRSSSNLFIFWITVRGSASSSLADDVRPAAPIRELTAISRAMSGLFTDISRLLVCVTDSMLTMLASSSVLPDQPGEEQD